MENNKGMFKESYDYIVENRDKEFNCIPFESLPRLSKFIPGIIQGNYYLIGAYSGDGKTNTTDALFLYDAYDFYKREKNNTDIKISWIYFSFEVVKRSKAIKAVSRKMFMDYNITADLQFLSGFKEHRASDEVFEMYKHCMEYYEEMEDMMIMKDIPENPTGLNKAVWKFAEENGTIHTKEVTDNNGKTINVFDHYEPDHPNHYVMIIVDHIALSPLERGFSTKMNIDKISEYAVGWRNRFNFIPVFIQQFSADTLSIDRQKAGKLEPDLNSFGDSKYTVRDANVVLSLFNPFKFELESHRGYNIGQIQDNYRYISLLKSRDGAAFVGTGMYFNGAVNYIRELPKANNPEEMKKVLEWMKEIDKNNIS
jgi:hypothetical protein